LCLFIRNIGQYETFKLWAVFGYYVDL